MRRTLGLWRVVAVAVSTLSWGTAAAAVVLLVVHGTTPPDGVSFWLMDVVSAFLYGGAALLMLPRSRHPVAWIMVLVGLGCGVSALFTQLRLVHPTGLAGLDPVALFLLGFAAWMPGTYATLAVMPWLVAPGRERALRPMVVLGAIATGVSVVAVFTASYEGKNRFAITWGRWQDALDLLARWPDRLCVALAALGTLRFALLWRRHRGTPTTGFGWLAAGQLLMVLAFVPGIVVRIDALPLEAAGVALLLAQAFLPVALLVVVLRQQLWGVDLAVSRVTVWTLMTSGVLVGYGLLVWLSGEVLPDSRGPAGFLAAGLAVAVGQPLRFWIQEQVDRLVYGPAADPARLLGTLGDDLQAGDTGSSLDALTHSLRTGLRLGGVEVRSADGAVKAVAGRVATAELDLPLTVEGRRLGSLWVSAPTGQRIDPRTRRLVEQMSGVLGVALELAQVNERLATASGRLVEVRHEERRMLRRDIHDGMGPALAGIGLGLAAAQRRLTRDPVGTGVLLAELEAEVERRTEDVRLLARALLPAQLDDGDLALALEVLADRFRASGLKVETDCGSLGPVETRRQVAIYHVAAEALMNAYRHARASSVHIEVASSSAAVVLEVVDDGRGLADDRKAGVGLQSMRERTDELGGELSIGPREDGPGTRVRMRLP